jgi:hypothetical protein
MYCTRTSWSRTLHFFCGYCTMPCSVHIFSHTRQALLGVLQILLWRSTV